MDMREHIGVKLVNARPMTLGEYNRFRGWNIPPAEDPLTPGYLVEYRDGGKPNTDEYAGYVSWSPSDVFEQSYRPTDGLTFGLALEALKLGKRVARSGWNGKDMWLALSGPNGARIVPAAGFWSEHNRDYAIACGGHANVLPCITMKVATGEILMGWLASQTDMLAEDWKILD